MVPEGGNTEVQASVETAAAENTSSETQSAPEAVGGEAISVKLQGQQEGQTESVEGEADTSEGEAVKPETEAESELSDEMSKFMQDKGLDPSNVTPEVAKVLDMYRNAEQKMNEVTSERDKLKQANLVITRIG